MNVSSSLLILGLVSGIALGSLYALVALSYTLVLAGSGIFNFAQSGLLTAAAVLTYVLAESWHITPLAVVAGVMVAGGVVGFICELLTALPFLRRLESLTEEALVSTLGMGLTITAIVAILFGNDSKPVQPYLSRTAVSVGSYSVQTIYILMFVVAVLAGVALDQVIARTSLGAEFRAIAMDREQASLYGINPQKVLAIAFVLAGVLSGLAGFLIVPVTSASSFVGDNVTLFGFAGMAIGGYGSFRGSIIGGLIVGIVSGLVPVFLTPDYTRPLLFGLLVLVLVIRPGGLFGSAGQFGAAALREV